MEDNICFAKDCNVEDIIFNDIRKRGKPFGHPFRTSEYPGKENIRKYGLRKCNDCGGWFPWFGGW